MDKDSGSQQLQLARLPNQPSHIAIRVYAFSIATYWAILSIITTPIQYLPYDCKHRLQSKLFGQHPPVAGPIVVRRLRTSSSPTKLRRKRRVALSITINLPPTLKPFRPPTLPRKRSMSLPSLILPIPSTTASALITERPLVTSPTRLTPSRSSTPPVSYPFNCPRANSSASSLEGAMNASSEKLQRRSSAKSSRFINSFRKRRSGGPPQSGAESDTPASSFFNKAPSVNTVGFPKKPKKVKTPRGSEFGTNAPMDRHAVSFYFASGYGLDNDRQLMSM